MRVQTMNVKSKLIQNKKKQLKKAYKETKNGKRWNHNVISFLLSLVLISTQLLSATACAHTAIQADQSLYTNTATQADQSLECKIDTMMAKYIGISIQGAAIAVVKEDELIYMKGFGYADKEKNIAVDPQSTIFEYGSLSKLFVWIAAMQLAEQKKLDLNQDVRSYLPEELKKKFTYEDKVTMLDLMNHTAGFDDYIIGLFNREDDLIDLKTWLMNTDVRQYLKPGEKSVYSNYGAALAGFIIEQVSGLEFREYVTENIYKKAGLSDIYPESILPKGMLEHKSKAYKNAGSELTKANATYISAYPAGAANGTAEELAKFAIALLKDESPLFEHNQTRNEVFETSWLPEHGVMGTGMSHGFFQYPSDQLVLWHNGETANFSSFFLLIPEEKMAVCMVCNTGGEKVLQAEREIAFSFAKEWNTDAGNVETANQTNTNPNTASEEVIDPTLVAGNYQSLRRCHHGITQLLYLISPFDKIVSVNEDQTITIANEVYQQVKPYVFYCKESGRSIDFTTDGQEKVTGCHQLVGFQKISTFGVILYYLKAVLLLILLVVSVGYGIRKKGLYRKTALFLILLIGNVVLIAIRALNLQYFSAITGQIIVNYLITAAILISGILQMRAAVRKATETNQTGKKEAGVKETIVFYGMVFAFLFILASYGIYTIAG